MPFVARRIDGLLHAPQNGVVHGMLLWLASDSSDDALDFEATLQALALNAELLHEGGQSVQLSRLWRLVYAAKEMQTGLGEHSGHRLVRRQHELLDHLMAFGVLDQVRADDFAALVEVNLHFRKRQFDGAAFQSPAAEDHRQLVHIGQERPYCRRQLVPPRFAICKEFIDLFVGESPAALDRRALHFARYVSTIRREFHEG